jgi:hypothetical protein
MPKHVFEKGNKHGHGGARRGAGRKPDEFKAKCDALVESKEFFEWAAQVFAGGCVDPHVGKDGVVTMVPANVGGRTYLWKTLAEYAKGKPAQAVKIADGQKVGFLALVQSAEQERGLGDETPQD